MEAQLKKAEILKKEMQRKEALKRAERRKKFAKIVQYTKWIVIPFVGAMCVAVLAAIALLIYAIALGLIWLAKFMVTWDWKVLIAALGILIGGSLFILIVISSVKKLGSCLRVMTSALHPKPKKINQFYLCKVIVSPFQIFIDYVKVFKQNNCPAIKWDKD